MSVVADLRSLVAHEGFRKLFTVRLVSQCGDGMFQVGLATLFFFSPQTMATAGSVAGAFAVLLLPFTVVGPFAGPLLDRWSRRQTLAVGNAVRVLLTLTLATLLVTTGVTPVVYVLALVTLGVNRFLLSALSAGVPLVVPRDRLLVANTLTPTLGAVSAVVGGVLGFVAGALTSAERVADAISLVMAAVLFAAAAALALRLRRDQLGPTRRERAAADATAARAGSSALAATIRHVLRDMAAGARHLVARGTPGMALGVMTTQRFLYGVNFIALILISRNLLTDPADPAAGLAMFATLTAVSFAGNGLAIIATPLAHERMAPATWILVCLGLSAVSQLLLATTPGLLVVGVSAVLMGLGIQGGKIAVDTIVHRDTEDAYRGRAFALYDVLYNGGFVAAAALGALALPDTGWSRAVFLAVALAYVVVAALYRRGTRLIGGEPRPA